MLFLCAALAAASCVAGSTNRIQAVDHASAPAASTNDPVELEYEKLMEDDDAALAEIDGWIKENQAFADQGAAVPKEELNRRIMKRVEPVATWIPGPKGRKVSSRGIGRYAAADMRGDVGGVLGARKAASEPVLLLG